MPLMREVMEVRYLWRVPLHMRNDRLVTVLGHEPRTPIDMAVRKALSEIGVTLPEARDGANASKKITGPAPTA